MAKFYEGKDKDMFCYCGQLLGHYDKDDPNVHKLKCKQCKRWVWFVPKSGDRCVRVIPPRESSSGVRFY